MDAMSVGATRWPDLVAEPVEVLVHDGEQECPYLPLQRARLPMRLPARILSGPELDLRLAQGDRRSGPFLYRPTCSDCTACRALRIEVAKFQPRARHRRILRRGDAVFTTEIGPVEVTHERVALYNAHLTGRGLDRGGDRLDLEGYALTLATSCCATFEIRYRLGGRLVGVAVTDRGADSLSAVVTYYDPTLASGSPGIYSILKQIELCRNWGMRWLYLGLYVVGCARLAYKATFFPHEQLVAGQWRPVCGPLTSPSA